MNLEPSFVGSVSRRTRSRWDEFYKCQYEEIKKSHEEEEEETIDNEECTKDSDDSEKEDPVSVEEGDGVNGRDEEVFMVDSESSVHSEDSEGSQDSEESSDASIEANLFPSVEKKRGTRTRTRKLKRPQRKRARTNKKIDAINVLVDSIWKQTDLLQENPSSVLEKTPPLPLKFKFEDDHHHEPCSVEETRRKMEIESLFDELEMSLWESQNECNTTTCSSSITDDKCTAVSTDTPETPVSRCNRSEHEPVFDEQIGFFCAYCFDVLMDIKHVLPDFYVKPPNRCQRNVYDESQPHNYAIGDGDDQFQTSCCSNFKSRSQVRSNSTSLDLIADIERELYPHQREGFEFLWRNIAGDTNIDKLENLPASGGTGCIISHAPGTGKTRLTIVFLQAFMKLYPSCRPVIIAPRGMLLTWEQEFKKWKVGMDFHNLNEAKITPREAEIAAALLSRRSSVRKNHQDYARFVKIYSWMKGGSVLGVAYRLFEELAGERGNSIFKKMLLELPGILVMDEGHTPRNARSRMWKALTKVTSRRRIILSGTPFQNNFTELYNTICLVNPTFCDQIMYTGRRGRKRRGRPRAGPDAAWSNLTGSIVKGIKGDDGIKRLRMMIEPFVHVHKGGILQKTLPGMRDCLVILKPTDLQSKLLQNITQVDNFFEQVYLASIISVHPSLVSDRSEFSEHEDELKSLESDPDAGVKTRFLFKLIEISIRLHEKVLVFSQFIDPLIRIKNLLESRFNFTEGREVIYMDGHLSLKRRQRLINSFNDKSSAAEVMLASQRACSEGINLVGASRVVLLDVVWNPSVERQAICRAYRIGQQKLVYVYRLVTLTELKKYEQQAEKERISKLIFGEERACGAYGSVKEDRVLAAMAEHKNNHSMFEKIVHQPREVEFGDDFGFVDLKE